MLRTTCFAFALSATAAHADCAVTTDAPVFSPAQLAAIDQRANAALNGTGLIWQATRGDDTLILIGTIHIYDPRLDALMYTIDPLIEGADLVIVEATMDSQIGMQAALADNPDLAFITSGPTLIDTLPPETWEAVAEAVQARGIPSFMAAKMQPWFLNMNLALPACAMADIMAGRLGLDFMIMDSAARAGTPVQPLEDWTIAFDIFSAGTEADHLAALEMTLELEDFGPDLMGAMMDDYFAGNIARLWEAGRESAQLLDMPISQTTAMFAAMEFSVLTQRNINWMPIIEEATIDHDTIIIATGAAHLPGSYGLVHLLDSSGWTIAP